MHNNLQEALRILGPCSSSRLIQYTTTEYELTPSAARQRLARDKSIKKLAGIPLRHNSRFVYFEADYGSERFWDSLIRVLRENASCYGLGLAALRARNGIIPKSHFEIACGAPLKQKKHVAADSVLSRLIDANLVQIFNVPGIGECVELANQVAPDEYELSSMRARLYVESILLEAVKEWARRLGLASYDRIELRDQKADNTQPRVGTFCWDLTGPSYLAPMRQKTSKGIKPGFLACDILLGINIEDELLHPFLNKCRTLRQLPNIGHCLQMFIADGYENKAFSLAREEGVIAATPDSLFGRGISKSLQQLSELFFDIFQSKTPLSDNEFKKIDDVFCNLRRIEGAAINLRGALFEYLVAELVRHTSISNDIEVNKTLRDDSGNSAEVDVLVVHRNNTIRFIECKGYKPGGSIPDENIDRWLNDRIPLIRSISIKNQDWSNCRFIFEFWTTGIISQKSIDLVENAKKKVRKYKLELLGHSRLKSLVKQSRNMSLKKTLNEHFLEHPLKALDPVIPPHAHLENRLLQS